ncbi:MAG: hypothetical protein HWE08_12970 [Alphaproteobacteria bacterium]|nr:hypothetical protein [Alphaproteobacteria bacterium]
MKASRVLPSIFVLLAFFGSASIADGADDAATMLDPSTSSDSIFGTAWGMTLALDGSGFYNDVLQAVLDNAETEKNYKPLPYRRAKVEFFLREHSCLYPTEVGFLIQSGEIDNPEDYIQTVPLIWVESHLFSRYELGPLASFDDLKGARIAYPNGSALPSVLDRYGPSFVPTTSETAKARMLIAGRVDHMSGSLPDNLFVFRAMGRKLPPYNPDLALARVGVSVVCHATPENQAFVAAFDESVAGLYGSGAMQALFEAAGVDLRFLPHP